MGATVPPDLPGACLPACLISLVETLSGPWEPAHLSPVSPLRAGSDMAPCLGPWNPGCQRLCQSPSHLRGRPSPEQQSHTPLPFPLTYPHGPLLARGPVCCWWPSQSHGALDQHPAGSAWVCRLTLSLVSGRPQLHGVAQPSSSAPPRCPWLCPCSGLTGASPCPEEARPTV